MPEPEREPVGATFDVAAGMEMQPDAVVAASVLFGAFVAFAPFGAFVAFARAQSQRDLTHILESKAPDQDQASP